VLFAARRPSYALKRLDTARAVVAEAEEALGPIRFVIVDNYPPNLMATMMNAADCLLLTSACEGSPMVVKEPVMCNLRVLSTDVGDVRQVLQGITPSAVCGHDVAQLSAALTEVLATRGRSNGYTKSA